MVELLAPAGSFEALKAAVENGANAVYLAGASFGARAYAENFTEEIMREAVNYAHLRGTAIHVTVNTIVDDSELSKLADYLRFLYAIGVDAILVQDLGVAKLAKTIIPDMPLHASTQMTVHNLAGVRALEKLGFARVVLSREVTLKDIRYICANAKAEIEVFAHGALCVCYSGQCLMSSMIGGRSGNRGRCAQPCRLPYHLLSESGRNLLADKAGEYLLSPRDLNTIDLLPELVEAGVASLKIEGRMKRPEYVGIVIDTYRRAIDTIGSPSGYKVSAEDKRRLAQIFNRDFTTAYLLKHEGKNMMSDRRPNNRGLLVGRVVKYDHNNRLVTVKLSETVNLGDELDFWVKVGGRVTVPVQEMTNAKGNNIKSAVAGEQITFALKNTVHEHDRVFRVYDAALMEKARQTFKSGSPIRRIPVKLAAYAYIGKPLQLSAELADGRTVFATSEFIGVPAEKRPLTEETLEKQLRRIGTTVYEISELTMNIGENVMFPVSAVNDTRRQLFDAVDEARLKCYARPAAPEVDDSVWKPGKTCNAPAKKNRTQLIVSTDDLDSLKAAVSAGADGILFGGESYSHSLITAKDYEIAREYCVEHDVKIIFNTPRIINEVRVKDFTQLADVFARLDPSAVNVHNIAGVEFFRRYPDLRLQADYSLITYNHLTLEMLQESGFSKAVLSPELNLAQIAGLVPQSPLPLECIVHGRLELMVSEYCVTGSFLGGLDSGSCKMPCRQGRYYLSDRKNERFPIVMDQYCHLHVLNAKTLSMLPNAMQFNELGVDSIRIEGKYLSAEEIARLTAAYQEFLNYPAELSEAEKAHSSEIEGKDITRGHYYRGVL